jgi:E3 ubiquitin-protein ligase DOA10
MRHAHLILTALLLGSLAVGPADAGQNNKKKEREAQEALQASPACRAIEKEYDLAYGKFQAAEGAAVSERARDLVDIRRRYKAGCGEPPKSMRDDLSKDVRKENKEMARDARADAREARKDAKQQAREVRQDERAAAKDAQQDAREMRDHAKDGQRDARAADRDARPATPVTPAVPATAATPAAPSTSSPAKGSAHSPPTPSFKSGANTARCTKLLADMRATDARFAACGKDKACRKQEKSGYDLNQAVYAGQCGDLPKDLKKIG